jgi:hypothetical protein
MAQWEENVGSVVSVSSLAHNGHGDSPINHWHIIGSLSQVVGKTDCQWDRTTSNPTIAWSR